MNSVKFLRRRPSRVTGQRERERMGGGVCCSVSELTLPSFLSPLVGRHVKLRPRNCCARGRRGEEGERPQARTPPTIYLPCLPAHHRRHLSLPVVLNSSIHLLLLARTGEAMRWAGGGRKEAVKGPTPASSKVVASPGRRRGERKTFPLSSFLISLSLSEAAKEEHAFRLG